MSSEPQVREGSHLCFGVLHVIIWGSYGGCGGGVMLGTCPSPLGSDNGVLV
jgi:hypothetical protein